MSLATATYDPQLSADIANYHAVSFFVAGRAEGQGNMSAVGGRVFHKKTPELMAWREAIRHEAQGALSVPLEGPVGLVLAFRLQKPKTATKKVRWPAKRPDIDKLVRAALDAGTGVMYMDDGQVCQLSVSKRFALPGEQLGVMVTLEALN